MSKMKKIISGLLITAFLTFNIFPTDKFDRIADKTCKTITGQELVLSNENTGLSTGEKVILGAAGAAAVGYGAYKLYKHFKNDKYDKIADKAYEKIVNKN